MNRNNFKIKRIAIKINYNIVIAAITRFYKKIRKIRMFHLEGVIGLCLIPKTPHDKTFFYPRINGGYYCHNNPHWVNCFYVTIKILDGMVNINYPFILRVQKVQK